MTEVTLTKRPPPNFRGYVVRLYREFSAHPIAGAHPGRAVARALAYQVAVRLKREIVLPWIEGSRLAVSRGMRGASGNIYCGLGEYAEMGFFLHFLRKDDIFFDLGANIGSYTVLASKVCGARTMAVEPDPETLAQLRRNITVNDIGDRVEVQPYALADHHGTVQFWIGWDTSNRIAAPGDGRMTQTLPCRTLDEIATKRPIAIKMDLEGGEEGALKGATKVLSSPELQVVASEAADGEIPHILHRAGFKRVYYDPATRAITQQPNSLKVADALFVRDVGLCQARVMGAPARRVAGLLI